MDHTAASGRCFLGGGSSRDPAPHRLVRGGSSCDPLRWTSVGHAAARVTGAALELSGRKGLDALGGHETAWGCSTPLEAGGWVK